MTQNFLPNFTEACYPGPDFPLQAAVKVILLHTVKKMPILYSFVQQNYELTSA